MLRDTRLTFTALRCYRNGTLLYGVSTRNSTPTPIDTQNRNSTRVGTGILWGNVRRSVIGKTESGGRFRSNQAMGGT